MTRIIATIVTGLVIGSLTLTSGACSQTANARLQATAEALSRSADECLYDVRVDIKPGWSHGTVRLLVPSHRST